MRRRAAAGAWLQLVALAVSLLAWLRLIALDGDLARAEPQALRFRLLSAPGPQGHPRPPQDPQDPTRLGLGQ